ncbi:MAG: hypothetical protein K2K80_06020, partial [Clostridia bacterium]|nr:hypothetical protein [Clostridia bacterium]
MKINYNILWVEDYPKDMEKQLNRIEKVLKNNFFLINGKDKPITSYEKFLEFIKNKTEKDFSDIDLILIDYNLSS